MDILAVVTFLALLIEWVTERFFGSWLKGLWMVLVSAALGVGLCLAFGLDVLALTGIKATYNPLVGETLSGIIIGGGANAVHKFIKPTDKGGTNNGEPKGGGTA